MIRVSRNQDRVGDFDLELDDAGPVSAAKVFRMDEKLPICNNINMPHGP